MKTWVEKNGIKHLMSPSYHPTSDGLAERAVVTAKRVLEKLEGAITAQVERFIFICRNTSHSTTNETPAYLMACHIPRTHLDLISPKRALWGSMQEKQADEASAQSWCQDTIILAW